MAKKSDPALKALVCKKISQGEYTEILTGWLVIRGGCLAQPYASGRKKRFRFIRYLSEKPS